MQNELWTKKDRADKEEAEAAADILKMKEKDVLKQIREAIYSKGIIARSNSSDYFVDELAYVMMNHAEQLIDILKPMDER